MRRNRISAIFRKFYEAKIKVLILLNKGYSRRPPPIKKVATICFYNVPEKFNTYKAFHQDHKSNVRIISLVSNEESLCNLLKIENKMG